MNKPTYKKIFWNHTLQNFSLAFMTFAVIDITLSCTMISCARSEMRQQAEDILNTPDLVHPDKVAPDKK